MPPSGFFGTSPKLQYVPILIGEDGGYPIEANRYLDERCNGEWSLPGGDRLDPVIPTLKSRLGIASRLSLFLRWTLKQRSRDWRSLSYDQDIVLGYQQELLTGKRTASGRALGAASTNLYVDEACLFLSWAAERGYRGSFKVRKRQVRAIQVSSHSSHSGRAIKRLVRSGAITVPETPLTVPTDEEVQRWIHALTLTSPVKALMFEFICRTGARLSEVNQMRLSCFPQKTYQGRPEWNPNWIADGKVPLLLRYGVKGPKVSPSSALSVKQRTVYVPLDLADRILHYKKVVRPTLLYRHKKKHPNSPATDRLWLGEQKLQPVSNQMLWRAWTKAPHCPDDWSPHKGRHYFAVEEIAASTRALLKTHNIAKSEGADFGWIHGLMSGQIRVILSPLLGHSTEATTSLYLRSAMTKMARELSHPSIVWNLTIGDD